jgi:acetyl-CoA carboxylase biotin carboxyl carrier protein
MQKKTKRVSSGQASADNQTGDGMGEGLPAGESFDLAKLQQLFELMEKHDLTDVQLRNGETQWRLRRGTQQVYAAPMVAAPMPVAAPMAQAAAPAAPPLSAAPASEDAGGLVIKSPTVGTFYGAPTPDDPAFVQVGTKVNKKTVVCLIEAMKVFNQIEAEVDGTISAVLVKNGDPVEFGQPLFRVSP